jgi:penicillin-binding protein 1C
VRSEPHNRFARRFWLALGLVQLCVYAAIVGFICAPLPERLMDYRPVASVRILDRDGGLLRELLSRADGRSTPVEAWEIPDSVRSAFIAAEDKDFSSHWGISPAAMARALWQNVRARRWVAGGSTLTQQLARTLVPRKRTMPGKFQEALWALRLEVHLSKEEILTQYLNRIPFGNNAYGIEAAAQLYFGRRAKYLSLAQAAMMAAVPRGTTAYNPYRNPARLAERKAWVLRRMATLELIEPEQAEAAAVEPLDLQAFTGAFRAPHFSEFIAANLERWGLGEATVIETSLDPELQLDIEDQVAQEIARLKDRRVGSAAVLVIDNRSSEVLAYVGSPDFFSEAIEGQNDGVQMKRQPGSSLKPFLYSEAFSAGFTPATVIPDLEARFPGRRGAYSPKNYDRRTHGPVRVREALANSYNVPAVQVADALGAERILELLQRAGFESLHKSSEHYGLGLVLGNGEVSLWQGARAYAGLSRGGVLQPLRAIRRALRADGTEIPIRSRFRMRRFAEPSSAELVTHILADHSARARAFGLDSVLRLPFPAAVKTGTSKGYSDNWTFGYTRERTVAVWAGNFDRTPMIQVSGIAGAGPMFKRAMVRAMEGLRPAPLVDMTGLEEARICPLSGQLAGPRCPAAMDEIFAAGTRPVTACPMHRGLADSLPKPIAQRCQELGGAEHRLVDLGDEFYDWARAEGLAQEPWLANECAAPLPTAAAQRFASPRIVSPHTGDEFLLFPDLPLRDQAIPLRIRASPGEGSLEVRLDDRFLFRLEPPFSAQVPARSGEHLLSLHRPDDLEPLAQVRFRVREEHVY